MEMMAYSGVSRKVVFATLFLLSFGSLASPAKSGSVPGPLELAASDTAGMYHLEGGITVTATRGAKATFETANTIQSLAGGEINYRQMSRTLPEALERTPGVMVQKTSNGQGSPYMRGFTGFRTMFLIDGIRLNNSVLRDGPNQYWNTVDPFTVSRMEVIKGPGSVLYGSDAIGGTVALLTHSYVKPGDRPLPPRRVYYRYSSAENASVGRVEVSSDLGAGLSFIAGASLKDFGDVKAGGVVGLQPRTGYDEWDVDFKLNYEVGDDARLVLAHQQVEQDDAWRSHKTIYGISWRGTEIGPERKRSLDQSRRLTYLQYYGPAPGKLVDRLTVSLSYQWQEERQHRIKSGGESDRQGFDVGTAGLWLQFLSTGKTGKWTYGIDYYRDRVSSFKRKFNTDGSPGAIEIQGPIADDATYQSLGSFIQNDFDLSDRFNGIAGLRYTFAEVRANRIKDPVSGKPVALSRSYDNVVGSLRLLYRIDQGRHWNSWAGLSQGFRAPNLSDLTRFDSNRSDEIETPSLDVKPEKFLSYELGIKARYNRWSSQLAFFYTAIDGMIVRAPTGGVIDGENEVTKRNSGDGFVRGFEFAGRVLVRRQVSVLWSLAVTDGEVDTYPSSEPQLKRETISRLMPTTGQLGLRWEEFSRDGWIEFTGTVADRQNRLSTRDSLDLQRIPPGGTPGYVVLTVRGGFPLKRMMNLSVAVENLTDKEYRIHGSGQNEPGRNLVVGMDLKFK